MKILLIVFTILMGIPAFSQLEDEQLDSLKKVWTRQITLQMDEMGIGTIHQDGLSDFSDSVLNSFERDTFLVNQLYSLQLDSDQTTYGMARATWQMEEAYDVLLNKYYNQLLRKLNKEDREILKESQRNWIKFRDSEKQLNGLLTEEKYSGGGTIQQLIYTDSNAGRVQQRVYELIGYLIRF
jgi:uncharacterized protein YecT (DUF1311 family)